MLEFIGKEFQRFNMKVLVVFVTFGLVFGQRNHYHGNPDGIVFPGPINSKNRGVQSRTCFQGCDNPETSLSRSLALARQLNELDSVDDFLNMVDGVPPEELAIPLVSRMGGVERTSASLAVPAKCMPELQPVSFPTDKNDHSVVYYPACTRIKRCGGCCQSSLLSCQPTATETRNFMVWTTKINGDGKLKWKGKEIIPLEEHTSCDCLCRIKEEHCTAGQEYMAHECRCRCKNTDEEAKCRSNNETKLWDPDACNCFCRVITECNTGFDFDHNTCRCRPSSSQANQFEGPYRFPSGTGDIPPIIVPIDASDPRRRHKDEPNF